MNALLMRMPFLNRASAIAAKFVASGLTLPRWAFEQVRQALRTLRTMPWTVLRARLLIGLTVVAISVFWGVATPILQWGAVYILAGLVLSVFILIDFRVGVATLILLYPVSNSTLFPHEMFGITGFNPLNVLFMATLTSYIVSRTFGTVRHRFLPRDAWWLYILPITLAAIIGSMHIGEIPGYALDIVALTPGDSAAYLRDFFLKPMYEVLFALLVAAAVMETRRVEGYLVAGLVSLWVVMLAVLIFFLLSGLSLNEISGEDGSSRSFFSPLGFHGNVIGRFFAVAFGMLLFSASAVEGIIPRIVVWGSTGITALATLISFSRGSYLVLLIIAALYLKSLKGSRRILILALVLPALLFVLPGAVYNRISFGLLGGGDLNTVSSGRTDEIWKPLFPEIFNSPVIGHGLSSILWSDAMKSGTILVVNHPHNAFLKSLLDMGFLGTILVFVFGWRVWKRMQALAREPMLEPPVRGFFLGASAALVGFTVAGISGSSFDPDFEKLYLWFAIGLMYGLSARLKSSRQSHG